jgi:hypothetical protein
MDAPNAAAASLPVSTVLRNAAELIEQRGWCQGTSEDDSGRVCAIGAIVKAAGYYNGAALQGAKVTLMQLIPAIRHDSLVPIAAWNDERMRSAAEVIATLREAAALAESEGR